MGEWHVTLHIDDHVEAAVGIEPAHGLEHAVGPGGVVGPRHDGLAARLADGGDDVLRIGGNHHAPGIRRGGAAPHAHDHGLAADVDQGLTRQAGGLHAGRNDDERALHWRVMAPSGSTRVTIRLGVQLPERAPLRLQGGGENL
jgi:hypothetical protein